MTTPSSTFVLGRVLLTFLLLYFIPRSLSLPLSKLDVLTLIDPVQQFGDESEPKKIIPKSVFNVPIKAEPSLAPCPMGSRRVTETGPCVPRVSGIRLDDQFLLQSFSMFNRRRPTTPVPPKRRRISPPTTTTLSPPRRIEPVVPTYVLEPPSGQSSVIRTGDSSSGSYVPKDILSPVYHHHLQHQYETGSDSTVIISNVTTTTTTTESPTTKTLQRSTTHVPFVGFENTTLGLNTASQANSSKSNSTTDTNLGKEVTTTDETLLTTTIITTLQVTEETVPPPTESLASYATNSEERTTILPSTAETITATMVTLPSPLAFDIESGSEKISESTILPVIKLEEQSETTEDVTTQTTDATSYSETTPMQLIFEKELIIPQAFNQQPLLPSMSSTELESTSGSSIIIFRDDSLTSSTQNPDDVIIFPSHAEEDENLRSQIILPTSSSKSKIISHNEYSSKIHFDE